MKTETNKADAENWVNALAHHLETPAGRCCCLAVYLLLSLSHTHKHVPAFQLAKRDLISNVLLHVCPKFRKSTNNTWSCLPLSSQSLLHVSTYEKARERSTHIQKEERIERQCFCVRKRERTDGQMKVLLYAIWWSSLAGWQRRAFPPKAWNGTLDMETAGLPLSDSCHGGDNAAQHKAQWMSVRPFNSSLFFPATTQ